MEKWTPLFAVDYEIAPFLSTFQNYLYCIKAILGNLRKAKDMQKTKYAIMIAT